MLDCAYADTVNCAVHFWVSAVKILPLLSQHFALVFDFLIKNRFNLDELLNLVRAKLKQIASAPFYSSIMCFEAKRNSRSNSLPSHPFERLKSSNGENCHDFCDLSS